MSDPGLTNRLRQRSRRAGLAVGLSMALTIAVCVGGFAWIYAQVDPFFADLVGSDAKATTGSQPTPTAEGTASGSHRAADDQPTKEPTEQPAEPTRTQAPRQTPTPEEFRATHITNPNSRVNFRPEPNLNTDPIAQLDPGTPVQALGDEEVDGDGNRWLKFRTEDGLEGWLREDAFDPI
jgi:Bacterial SH3 domain